MASVQEDGWVLLLTQLCLPDTAIVRAATDQAQEALKSPESFVVLFRLVREADLLRFVLTCERRRRAHNYHKYNTLLLFFVGEPLGSTGLPHLPPFKRRSKEPPLTRSSIRRCSSALCLFHYLTDRLV
jgi:hypothetical protein